MKTKKHHSTLLGKTNNLHGIPGAVQQRGKRTNQNENGMSCVRLIKAETYQGQIT